MTFGFYAERDSENSRERNLMSEVETAAKKPGKSTVFGSPKPLADALLHKPAEAAPQEAAPQIEMLEPSIIQASPWQPRTLMDEPEMIDLTEDVRLRGVRQPVTVRLIDGVYHLVFGHRRQEAAKRAGVLLPCIVREMSDQEAAEEALIENLIRADLNPIEEARGYKRLLDEFKMTQEQLAKRIHRSQPMIANALRLLQLPDDVQAQIGFGLSASHGLALCALDNPADIQHYALKAVEGAWSVKSLETEIAAFRQEEAKRQQPELPANGEEEEENRIVPAPANAVDTTESDKRLVLAVLKAEGALWGAVVNATGLNRYRNEMAMRELVDEGKARIEGDRWFLIPSSSQIGDYNTPSSTEKHIETKAEPKGQNEAVPNIGNNVSDSLDDSPVCRQCGKSEAQVEAAGAHMTKFDLCSGCDPEAQAAAQTQEQGAVPAPEQKAKTKKADAFSVDDGVQWNDGKKSFTGIIAEVGSALYFVQPTGTKEAKHRKNFNKKNCILKPWDKKSAPESASASPKTVETPATPAPTPAASPKVPEGKTWILADEKSVFACQDAGLTIDDVFAIVQELASIGKPFGLMVPDVMTTIKGYFGVGDSPEVQPEAESQAESQAEPQNQPETEAEHTEAEHTAQSESEN